MEIRAQHGVKKVLLKLENSIQNGNYYEAHQMYKTIYFRYLGQKRYIDLIHLLYNGSLLLLQHEQYTSGADLGILLIDVLKKSQQKPSEDFFEKLMNLFFLMNPLSPEREIFVQNAVKWSACSSSFKTGHPDLHRKLAHIYWKEKNYNSAKSHFLYSNDSNGCASMLIELHKKFGYSNEVELFITQIILQLLCLQNKTTASEIYKIYVSQHPNITKPPYIHPLLNFLFCLLDVIESRKHTLFTVLYEQYFTCLTRDPCNLQYLDRIGQIFFKIQPSQNCNEGLLNTFLNSFFDGLDNDDATNASTINLIPQTSPELD